jgi:hypothetical protein
VILAKLAIPLQEPRNMGPRVARRAAIAQPKQVCIGAHSVARRVCVLLNSHLLIAQATETETLYRALDYRRTILYSGDSPTSGLDNSVTINLRLHDQ